MEIPSLPLPPAAVGRVGPGVRRVGEQAMYLTGATLRNETCASPGQHSRAGPDSKGTDEPSLKSRELESWGSP